MKPLSIWIVAVLAFAGCNKPSEGDCRKAIANMQHLMGTESLRDDPAGVAAIEGEVRRCKGGSKRKAVQCAIAAKTLADLQHCDFYHVPANAKGVGSGTDSAGSAGSAGSAAPAAPAASAAPAAGSATGSGSAGAAMGGGGMAGSDGAAGSAGSASGSGSH